MSKFKLSIKVIEGTQWDKVHDAGVDTFSASWGHKEEWIVTNQKGNVVDKKVVDISDSSGMSGMRHHWTVCNNGHIVWDTGLGCDECAHQKELAAKRRQKRISKGFSVSIREILSAK